MAPSKKAQIVRKELKRLTNSTDIFYTSLNCQGLRVSNEIRSALNNITAFYDCIGYRDIIHLVIISEAEIKHLLFTFLCLEKTQGGKKNYRLQLERQQNMKETTATECLDRCCYSTCHCFLSLSSFRT